MTLTYRNTFMAVFAVGYVLLLTAFFSAQSDTSSAATDVAPYAVIGLAGLLVLFLAPNKYTPVAETDRPIHASIFGCGQRLSAVQISAIVATGFAFGAVLSKTVRAFA